MLNGMLSKIVKSLRTDAPGVTLHDVGLVLVAFSVLGSLGYGVFAYGPRLASTALTASDGAAPIETATIKLVEASRPAAPPPAAATPAAAPPLMRDVDPEPSFEIVRKLQTGLKRAGCYKGKVNGAWTSTSRRAMRSFAEAVNAQLPVDKPNTVLLALMDAHPDASCNGPKGRVAAQGATDSPRTSAAGSTPAPSPSSIPSPESTPATRQAGVDAEAFPRPALIPDAPVAGEEPEAAPAAATRDTPPPRKQRTTKKRSKPSQSPASLADSFFKDVQKAFKSAF